MDVIRSAGHWYQCKLQDPKELVATTERLLGKRDGNPEDCETFPFYVQEKGLQHLTVRFAFRAGCSPVVLK